MTQNEIRYIVALGSCLDAQETERKPAWLGLIDFQRTRKM